jgi:hypothetical protein
MKCKVFICSTVLSAVIFFAALISFSCSEALPVYSPPQNVMSLEVTKVEQLNDHIAPPHRPRVHIVLVGENIFDEVFYDSVNIRGSMRIWWKRKPRRYRTIYLDERNMTDRSLIRNNRMMLLPGQRFSLEAYWDIRSDDGMNLISEMDFSYSMRRYCDFNVVCANPEEFVIEVSLNVFDRLGYISATPKEFKYVARACVCAAFPPCNLGGEC